MDVYILTPITRKPFGLDLTSTDEEGQPVVFTEIAIALLPPRTAPDDEAVWQTLAHDADGATLWIAGYDADPTGAVQIPEPGAVLWAYPIGPAVDPAPIARFIY